MQKFYFPLFFFLGISVGAAAQERAGQNTNPDAPVNAADLSQRPAQPAQYSATPVPNGGQFYVKDDKPATPQGQTLTPLTPEQREMLLKQKAMPMPAAPAPGPVQNQKGN